MRKERQDFAQLFACQDIIDCSSASKASLQVLSKHASHASPALTAIICREPQGLMLRTAHMPGGGCNRMRL